MSHSMADRLLAVRHQLFVGRKDEVRLLADWLDDPSVPYNLVYLSGPGGIGKTSLLGEFSWLCSQRNVPLRWVDGAALDATPGAMLAAVLPQDFRVLLLDGYEQLKPLDRWFVEHMLPQLAANTLVVLASRQAPSAAWQVNAAVSQLTRHRPLANFDAAESDRYLSLREVPQHQRSAIMSFTHGHPLALALAADTVQQKGDQTFWPEAEPNMLKTLLDHFIGDIPSAEHRAALEACALVNRTSESLLCEMVTPGRPDSAHLLFDWLRGLSFIDARADGISPHDIVREALSTELRWRHRDWYNDLHARARGYYHRRLAGRCEPQDVFDLVYLHRDNPVVKPFVEWKAATDLLLDRLLPTDAPALLAMTFDHEGEAARDLVAGWIESAPDAFHVVRDSHGQVHGFFFGVSLKRVNESQASADPGLRLLVDFVRQQAPLRGPEDAYYCRFWMDRDSYQGVSSVQSRIFMNLVLLDLSSPQLALSAIAVAGPDFWTPLFAYACAQRLPQDFEVGGRTYGIFYYDWRLMSPTRWLEVLAEREVNPAALTQPAPPLEAPAVLSQDQFNTAVKDALRNLASVELLLDNPLLRARFILATTGPSPQDRARTLQQALREAVESLKKTPRDAKLYRSLFVTYLEPAENQEMAAQQLDLPFSTYRRHLTAGVSRIQLALWQRELQQ